MAELRRWILVIVVGALVLALYTRTFYAVYLSALLVPLGLTALVRAVVRFARGLDRRNGDEISESYRSMFRLAAWAGLGFLLVYGHQQLAGQKKAEVEKFAMRVEDTKSSTGFPETMADVPAGCSYGRPNPQRFFVVCVLTPPFERVTYTSNTKRWE